MFGEFTSVRLALGLVGVGLGGGVMTTEGPFVSELKRMGTITVTTFEFGRRGHGDNSDLSRMFGLLWDLSSFVGLLIRYKPDVVQLNSAYFKPALLRDPAYVAISKIFRTHLLIKYHGSDAHLLHARRLPWRLLGQFCVSRAAGIAVLSSEEKRNFALAGFPAGRIWQVKNVVNCSRFGGVGQRQREPNQLLVISRFIPPKGLVESIEAMPLILSKVPSVTLTCVGDGPDRERAERRVLELDLRQSVHFTGRIPEEETIKFYLAASILVFPTYFDEGFPMTLFQALAAGLPVVTTRIRAAADYLQEPANCVWVVPRSPTDLAEKILYLLQRPHLMQTMSSNNRRLAQRFIPKHVVPEYLRIYEVILGKGQQSVGNIQ